MFIPAKKAICPDTFTCKLYQGFQGKIAINLIQTIIEKREYFPTHFVRLAWPDTKTWHRLYMKRKLQTNSPHEQRWKIFTKKKLYHVHWDLSQEYKVNLTLKKTSKCNSHINRMKEKNCMITSVDKKIIRKSKHYCDLLNSAN